MAQQLKSIDVSGDSLILRVYEWAWDASASNADTCKLFWGYLLLIPNVLVRVIAFPFVLLARFLCPPVQARVKERQETRRHEIEQAIELGEPIPKSRLEKFLSRIGDRLTRIGLWFKAHSWLGKVLLFVIVGGYIGMLLVFWVLAFVEDFWTTLLVSLGVIGGVLLILAIIAWIAWWEERSGKPGRGVKKFGQVIKAGYYSFKNFSCREIKVVD